MRDWDETNPIKTLQSSVQGTGPQYSPMVLNEGTYVVARKPFVFREASRGAIHELVEPVFSRHPQAAFPVLEHGKHRALGEPLAVTVVVEDAVMEAAQAVARSDPQVTAPAL